MRENVKTYMTTSGIGTTFQVGLNYETVPPGHDFVRIGDHLAALDAVLKEAIMFAENVMRNGRWQEDEWLKAQDFLASPSVRDYRARQEQG